MGKSKSNRERASKVKTLPLPLQIAARNTDRFDHGFPYPKALEEYGILKANWNRACQKMAEPLSSWKPLGLDLCNKTYLGIAYVLEDILDKVAEWDQTYFRPKGLIMRLDMPGEEKFGLSFMTMYHSRPSKHYHHDRPSSTERIRKKGFCCTRIVLDSVDVLKDSKKAYDHGWTNWIKACEHAKKVKEECPQPPMNNEPWDFSKLARRDRWPPSKHLYYDRFKGTEIMISSGNGGISYIFIPDGDSMDQRGMYFGLASSFPSNFPSVEVFE
jgi:hypothetical protein